MWPKVLRLRLDADKKRLLENFFSLSVLQGANYILPLITLPYLVRVLGPEKFGLIAFAQAFIQYFNILTDYGFNLSATREISIHRDNIEKVSEIFSSVMIIKGALLILSFLIMTAIVFSFERFRRDWLVYYLTFGMVIGQTLFPVWFFQGMERMKYITFLNITAKLIFTVSIFLFVHRVSDYLYVPSINSLGYIVAGIGAILVITTRFDACFKMCKLSSIKYHLKQGWYTFVSMVGISMYNKNAIVVLGLFADHSIVGYFSIAKKIIDMVNSLASTISQAIYPYSMRNISSVVKGFLKKIGITIASISLLTGVMLFFGSDLIAKIFVGDSSYVTSQSIRLLSIVPLIIGINVPAVHKLLGEKRDRLFTMLVVSGGAFDLLLNFLLVPWFSYVGSCVSIIISVTYLTVALYYYAFNVGSWMRFIKKDIW